MKVLIIMGLGVDTEGSFSMIVYGQGEVSNYFLLL